MTGDLWKVVVERIAGVFIVYGCTGTAVPDLSKAFDKVWYVRLTILRLMEFYVRLSAVYLYFIVIGY